MANSGSDRSVEDVREQSQRDRESRRSESSERRTENRAQRPVSEQRHMEARFREKMEMSDPDRRASREKRAEIVENMVRKDRDLSPEKRRNDAGNFHYRDSREFDRELRRREPGASPSDAQRTEGFFDPRDNQAYVRDTGDTLERATHEKLHQKSKSELPTRLDEGMAEHFTRKELGGFADLKTFDSRGREIPKPVSDYRNESQIVGKLEATIGSDTLHNAYFKGDAAGLRRETDRALGDGAYEQLTQALEKRDYESANRLFQKEMEQRKR